MWDGILAASLLLAFAVWRIVFDVRNPVQMRGQIKQKTAQALMMLVVFAGAFGIFILVPLLVELKILREDWREFFLAIIMILASISFGVIAIAKREFPIFFDIIVLKDEKAKTQGWILVVSGLFLLFIFIGSFLERGNLR